MHFGRISMSFLAALSVCIVLVVSAAPTISTKAPSSTKAPYLSTKAPTGSTKAPAPTPFSEPLFWNQLGGTINGPGAVDGHLGGAVDTSADGRIVAYGARNDDTCEGGYEVGTVRVSYYDSEKNKWMQLGQTLNGEEENDNFGKNVKLSADGHTLAVSANGDKSSNGKGYVEVYQYKEKSKKWKQVGKRILGELEGEGSGWGLSLSADGRTVAVGSSYHNASDEMYSVGQTRIFRFINSEWEQLGDSIYGEEANSQDGTSVDLRADGNMVVIGGPGAYSNQFPRARVFKYIKEDVEWRQVGDDLVGKTKDGEMGLAVSISGNGKTVAISAGCHYYCGSTPDNDRIKVYKLKAGEWKKVGESIYREDNEFSFAKTISLSEDGSTVALTAMRGLEYHGCVGLAKVYNLVDGNKWKKLGQSVLFRPIYRNPSYSNIIALSANGRALAVGSSENENSNVKVFELGSYKETPNPTHHPTASTRAPVAAPSTKAPTPTRSPRPSLQPKYWGTKGKLPKVLSDYVGTGSAVASSEDGNIVAIYSRFWNEETDQYSGTAVVYKLKSSNNKWKPMGDRIYGNPGEKYFGISLALSAKGDHFAIGSDTYDSERGRVNIYNFKKGVWAQLGESLIGKCRQDGHGWDLSLSDNGKTIAVGGYNGDKNTDDDGTANNSEQGYTIIYKYKGKTNKWKPLGEAIYGSGHDEEDGTSIDLSGDGKTVVIGGPYFGKGEFGRARVFKLINKKWKQVGNDIIGEVGRGEYGISVSMSNDGNIIAVGSGCYAYCWSYAGHVDVLKINSKKTKWKQLGNRISARPYDDRDFGNNVSLSDDGETVAIGAIGENGDINTKVFQLNNKKWDQVGQSIYGGEHYGSYNSRHVALSGDARTLVIGDQYENNKATVYSVDYDPA